MDLLGSPSNKPKKENKSHKHDKIEVNLDDVEDEDEDLLGYGSKNSKQRKYSTAEKQ